METIVKFKVLTEQGKKKSIKRKFKDCPDFKEIRRQCHFSPIECSKMSRITVDNIVDNALFSEEHVTSVADQIDKWVEDIDKLQWMHDNEVSIIFNWNVISYTGMKIDEMTGEKESSIIKVNEHEKKLSDIEHMKLFFEMNKDSISEDFVNDYVAVYGTLASKMKGIKWDKQMSITFGAMSIAAQGAIAALDNLTSYSKAIAQVDWNKYRYTEASDINKYGTWNLESIHNDAKRIQNADNTQDVTLIG